MHVSESPRFVDVLDEDVLSAMDYCDNANSPSMKNMSLADL